MTTTSSTSALARLFRAIGRHPFRSLLAVLAVIVLLVAGGALALMYTGPGRAVLARSLESIVSRPGEMELEIGEISGPLPGRIAVDRLALRDAQGPWLEARGLEIDWAPLALLGGRLQIDTASAEAVEVLRKPATPDGTEPPSEEGGIPALPPIEIDLKDLAAQRLRLAEPVLGQEASVKVGANGSVLRKRASALIEIERTDGRPGQARARLVWNADTESLDIDAKLSEPADGLVARLLDLPERPPIELAVDGEGPAGDWRGKLSLESGSLLSLQSSLIISVGDGFRLAMDGEAEPGEALGSEVTTLLGPRTGFAFELRRPQDSGDWLVTIGELASAAVKASGSAMISPADERIDGTLDIETADGKRLAPLVAPAAFKSGTAKIAFHGPITYPSIDLDGAFEGLAVEGVSADRASLQAELRPTGPLATGSRVEARGRASLEGPRTPWPEANALIGGQLQVNFEETSLERFERLEIGKLGISTDNMEASLTGALTLPEVALNATGKVTVGKLSAFSETVGRSVSGSAGAEFELTRADSGVLDLSVNGALREARLEQPVVEKLLGRDAGFGFKLRMPPGGPIAVSDIALRGAGADVAGKLSFDPDASRLEATYNAAVSDLQALELAEPGKDAGRLEVSGTLAGPLTDLKLSGGLNLSGAAAGGIAVKRLRAEYNVADLTGNPSGEVSLGAQAHPFPDIDARTKFQLADDRLQLSGFSLSTQDTTVGGSVAVSLEHRLASGDLRVESKNIGAWSGLAGVSLGGAVDGRLTLSAQGARQDVALGVSATGLRLNESLSVERANLDMRVGDVTGALRLDGTLAAKNARNGPVALKELSLTLNGPLRELAYRLRTSGDVDGRDLALGANGEFRTTAERTVLAVNSFSGKAAGVPIRLRNAVSLQFAPDIDTGNVALAVGDGTLTGHYRQSGGQVSARADVSRVPLASIWLTAPPQLNKSIVEATASLDGPVGGPAGKLNVNVTGVAAGETEQVAKGLTLSLAATLGDGEVTADGHIEGLEGVTSDMQLTLPAKLSLAPAAVSIDENGPLAGRASYVGPVGPTWGLLGLERHRLEGKGEMNLELSGTPGDPNLSGRVALTDGRYENLDTGTILTRMRVVALPDGPTVTIEKATASDGNGGEVSLDGKVRFGEGSDLVTLDLEAGFAKARLVRRDELTAILSGRVTLRGNQRSQKIAGKVEVEQAEVRLLGGGRPDVVEIEVEEKGTPPAGSVGAPPKTKPSRTELDIGISMPARVFVRGRGLDSEWGGNLTIQGPTNSPRIVGDLRPIRGQYVFAGKIFRLRDGSIRFTGADEVNPVLDLSAENKTAEMTAIIRVTGTAKDPKIDLESIPDYPDDEIVSRVLFNKSTGRLSALEAVQLAEALRTLTGSGGGGIMEFARGALGVDFLRFEGASEEGQAGSAEAGKYINDRVYLGVESKATGETGVSVEVEITPSLKLDSEIGSDDRSRTGLKWKKDY